MFSIPHAFAADSTIAGLENAKAIIKNATPGASQDQTDNSRTVTTDYLQKPLIVDTQVTIDPPKPVAVLPKKIVKTIKATATVDVSSNDGSSAHRFPYGYCTYYVASHRFVPWSGNAISWLSGARAFGFATGTTPQTGAILVTSEGGWTGHVALVDKVNDDGTITISEMNYAGFGVVSSRTISISYAPIKGYIY